MKKTIIALMFVFGLLSISNFAFAGSTPAFILTPNYDQDDEIATYPGGTTMIEYKVANLDADKYIKIKMMGSGVGSNPVQDAWYSFLPETVILEPNSETLVSVSVNVPEGSVLGDYRGSIKAALTSYDADVKLLTNEDDKGGVKISAAVGDRFALMVKDKTDIDVLDSSQLNGDEQAVEDTTGASDSKGFLNDYWLQILIAVVVLVLLGKLFLFSDNNKKK